MEKKKLWSKLPKKDKKHLREMNIRTKWDFERQVKFMKEEIKKEPDTRFFCWECREIADKLGMWEA